MRGEWPARHRAPRAPSTLSILRDHLRETGTRWWEVVLGSVLVAGGTLALLWGLALIAVVAS